MIDIQAAIECQQIACVAGIVAARRHLAERYHWLLAEIPRDGMSALPADRATATG